MQILITNDDGYDAPGIVALARMLQPHAEVFIVAPRTEQSGVSQAITFLRPLFPMSIEQTHEGVQTVGYAVDGTPTDCVKLALFELCPWKPDLIVSGINGGLNAGSNTAYSGTVAGALAGAMLGIPSIAVSLEYAENMEFDRAAEIAWPLISELAAAEFPRLTAFNINVPTAALFGDSPVVVVPVETNALGFEFDRGVDPKQRPWLWANNRPDPKPSPFETDASALKKGWTTISAISGNVNCESGQSVLEALFVRDTV